MIGRRPSSPKIEALRQKAKALVEAGPADVAFREERAFDSLLHDVSNSQEELELQNEQLRAAQAALEDSRNRYFEVFEIAPVAYLEVSTQGLVVDANRAAGQLFDLAESDLRGRNVFQLLPHAHRATLLNQRKDASESRRSEPREASVVTSNGDTVPVILQTTLLPSREPVTFLLALVDISRQKRTEEELEALARELEDVNLCLHELAMHDALTGLSNRRGFDAALAVELERAKRSGIPLCAILIDCDDFKSVNDGFGHAAGDTVLSTVAKRLAEVMRPCDQISRIGGDEFLVLLTDTNFAQATIVAERLRLAGAQPVPLSHGPLKLTLSLAVAIVDLDFASIEEILSATRAALKESKSRGKNRVSIAPGHGYEAPEALAPASVFQLLASSSVLSPVYAPIVDLATDTIVGHEILVRGPTGPLHMPVDLFRAASAESELTAVDLRCLTACLAAAEHLAPDAWRHVNLYPNTLASSPFERIASLLPASSSGLCVELSEQHMIGDPSSLRSRIQQLRQMGVRVAIDDVGFGRTCLETLIMLEPEVVKIDRAYIFGVARDTSKARLLRRLVRIAEAIRAVTVAEGIESQQDLEVVRDLGVRYGQGFFWGKPAALA